MSTDHATIETLTAHHCRQLLHTHPLHLGRVAFADDDGVPVVWPVNFRLADDHVVCRTGDGQLLAAVRAGRPVAFEADHLDPAWQDGWSVLVQGTATEVTDPDELDRLHRLPLHPWAPGDKPHWLRLATDHVTGRRIL